MSTATFTTMFRLRDTRGNCYRILVASYNRTLADLGKLAVATAAGFGVTVEMPAYSFGQNVQVGAITPTDDGRLVSEGVVGIYPGRSR